MSGTFRFLEKMDGGILQEIVGVWFDEEGAMRFWVVLGGGWSQIVFAFRQSNENRSLSLNPNMRLERLPFEWVIRPLYKTEI